MKRKILAIASLIVALFLIGNSSAFAIACSGTGYPEAPQVSGSYLYGNGQVLISPPSQLQRVRVQVVLQNRNGNIAGTASGWVYFDPITLEQNMGYTPRVSAVGKYCGGSGAHDFRTEVQFSWTDCNGVYSGIQYVQSSWVSRGCSAGY